MPKREKKKLEIATRKKNNMKLLKFYLRPTININLQTLTAKNRLDKSTGFLGIWEPLYIDTWVE